MRTEKRTILTMSKEEMHTIACFYDVLKNVMGLSEEEMGNVIKAVAEDNMAYTDRLGFITEFFIE